MKKIGLICVVLLVFLLIPISVKTEEISSKQINKKEYSDLDILSTKDRVDYINQIIDDKNLRWEARETSMSHFSKEEKKAMLIQSKPKRTRTQLLKTSSIKSYSYPSSLDWRNNNGDWTSPIKSQGSCGSCWAFSAVGVVESRINIALNNPNYDIDLSEQDLISCSGVGSCEGGQENDALEYIKSEGIVKESCFPYSATNGSCSSKCANWQNELIKVLVYNQLPASSSDIKQAIKNYGPVTVYVAVFEDFYDYAGGIYTSTYGDYLGLHAVSIVGYDDNNQYWICKNSWGTGWGESGYFRIAYSENILDFWEWYYNPADYRTFFLDDSYVVTNIDIDSDGVEDSLDNCPENINTDQSDIDNDGLGDVCDSDDDNDDVLDINDACPLVAGEYYNGCPAVTVLDAHTSQNENCGAGYSDSVTEFHLGQSFILENTGNITGISLKMGCSNQQDTGTTNEVCWVIKDDVWTIGNTVGFGCVTLTDCHQGADSMNDHKLVNISMNSIELQSGDLYYFYEYSQEDHYDLTGCEGSSYLNGTVYWSVSGDEVGPFDQDFLFKIHVLSPDLDQDEIADSSDNCPNEYNPNQIDVDNDNIGDACDPCVANWVLNENWDVCQSDDLQYRYYQDTNECGQMPLEPEVQACDYCTPSWECSDYTGCLAINKNLCDNVNDINSCYNQTNLSSDQYSGTLEEFSLDCDYCTPNLVQTNEACQLDDTFISWYADTNSCYEQTGLENDNIPENQTFSCDYCVPNWSEVIGECQYGDVQTSSYTDLNNCYATTNLESDISSKPENNTYTCDYWDDDLDGIADTEDKLTGDKSIIDTNIPNLQFRVGNLTNLTNAAGTQKVEFKDNDTDLVEFSWDFGSTLDLRNVKIKKQEAESTKGSLIITGINLSEQQKKTAYIDKIDTSVNTVCIRDAEINSTADISAACNETDEHGLACDNETHGDYTCTDLGSRYKIEGLSHSGIVQQCIESWSCTDWSSCSGSSQTRTCTDANSCGTNYNKPAESQSCTVPSSSGSSSGGGGGGGGGSPSKVASVPEPTAPAQPLVSLPTPREELRETEAPEEQPEETQEPGFLSRMWNSITGLFAGRAEGGGITGAVVGISNSGYGIGAITLIIIIFITVGLYLLGKSPSAKEESKKKEKITARKTIRRGFKRVLRKVIVKKN